MKQHHEWRPARWLSVVVAGLLISPIAWTADNTLSTNLVANSPAGKAFQHNRPGCADRPGRWARDPIVMHHQGDRPVEAQYRKELTRKMSAIDAIIRQTETAKTLHEIEVAGHTNCTQGGPNWLARCYGYYLFVPYDRCEGADRCNCRGEAGEGRSFELTFNDRPDFCLTGETRFSDEKDRLVCLFFRPEIAELADLPRAFGRKNAYWVKHGILVTRLQRTPWRPISRQAYLETRVHAARKSRMRSLAALEAELASLEEPNRAAYVRPSNLCRKKDQCPESGLMTRGTANTYPVVSPRAEFIPRNFTPDHLYSMVILLKYQFNPVYEVEVAGNRKAAYEEKDQVMAETDWDKVAELFEE